jgi:hypothetical protein
LRRLTEYAHILLQESKRLGRLVDNLLAYARIIDVRELYNSSPRARRRPTSSAA